MDEDQFRYTEAEAAMLARLANVRVAADSGSRAAKQQIKRVAGQLAALKRRARRDPRAARAAKVLEESGLLVTSQIFAMDGPEAVGVQPYSPPSMASSWTWKLMGLNVLNLGLLVATGALAWKRRWAYAAVPLAVLVAHEGHQKSWW